MPHPSTRVPSPPALGAPSVVGEVGVPSLDSAWVASIAEAFEDAAVATLATLVLAQVVELAEAKLARALSTSKLSPKLLPLRLLSNQPAELTSARLSGGNRERVSGGMGGSELWSPELWSPELWSPELWTEL